MTKILMALTSAKKYLKGIKGFTLIELIVVMAVFLFVIGAAISIFISVIQNQKKVLSEQQLLNQISYVEEYMSKGLRMATADTNGTACFGDSKYAGYIYLLTRFDPGLAQFKGIKFINQSDSNACQEFFLDNAVHGDTSTPLILKEEKNDISDPNDINAVAITPANLQIIFAKFSIDGSNGSIFSEPSTINTCTTSQCGASNTDTVQPRVTILLNVKITGDSQEPNRTIQTTISQRNLNVNNGQRP